MTENKISAVTENEIPDMTEDDMLRRIQEIENEQAKLKSEKSQYENILYKNKRQRSLDSRADFKDKYFVTANNKENSMPYVQAFKILNILSVPNEDYAECIVITNGIRTNCWLESGIQIMVLPLWIQNEFALMINHDKPVMIDMYKEITEKEFMSMYKRHRNLIDSRL